MWIRNILRMRFFPFYSTGSQVSGDLLSVGGLRIRIQWKGCGLIGSATMPQGAVFEHMLRDAKQFDVSQLIDILGKLLN
jgi:hypothetical protein